jgi:hypothetical protein
MATAWPPGLGGVGWWDEAYAWVAQADRASARGWGADWPGMKIGQLCLFRTSSPAEHPYGSAVYRPRYQDQRGPTPSRSYLNFYRTKVLQPRP